MKQHVQQLWRQVKTAHRFSLQLQKTLNCEGKKDKKSKKKDKKKDKKTEKKPKAPKEKKAKWITLRMKL